MTVYNSKKTLSFQCVEYTEDRKIRKATSSKEKKNNVKERNRGCYKASLRDVSHVLRISTQQVLLRHKHNLQSQSYGLTCVPQSGGNSRCHSNPKYHPLLPPSYLANKTKSGDLLP